MFIYIILGLLAVYASWKGIDIAEKKKNSGAVPNDVKQWQDIAADMAKKYNVPFSIIMAQIWQESWGDMEAPHASGEVGLMGLKPIAIQDLRLNKKGEFTAWQVLPEVNIEAGAAFLRLLYDRHGRSWETALKAYNQGGDGMKKNPGLAAEYWEKISEKKRFF